MIANGTNQPAGERTIDARGVETDKYIIYAIDKAGNVSAASEEITIIYEDFVIAVGSDLSLPLIKLFPNPVQDILRIEGLQNYQESVLIRNMSGATWSLTLSSNGTVNTRDLPLGIYSIHLSGHSPQIYKKLSYYDYSSHLMA